MITDKIEKLMKLRDETYMDDNPCENCHYDGELSDECVGCSSVEMWGIEIERKNDDDIEYEKLIKSIDDIRLSDVIHDIMFMISDIREESWVAGYNDAHNEFVRFSEGSTYPHVKRRLLSDALRHINKMR